MRKWMLLFCFVLLFPLQAAAEGMEMEAMLFDGDLETAQQLEENASIRLENPEGIEGIYLVFDRPYGIVTLALPDGEEYFADTGGILHCYIDLEDCFDKIPEAVSICFSDGSAELCELAVFAPGLLPDWVQRWEKIPDGKADLVLFSTHGDDEQLFFAGLLPWYGAELGKRVQVVYFTDHRNMTTNRVHEMLNGLWAVGIRDYPVFGSFDDYYTFDLEDAYRHYEEAGQSRDTLLSFVVEQLRRFRPDVAVGHDIHGEYGHGMHQLYTDLLCKAVEVSANPSQFPELAEQYGVWDVPKTYLHLYEENPIVMDWDIPLEAFDGKTAYEVSRDYGFPSHKSQQENFSWYFRGADRAADVAKYSPCRYGLYRSTVGEDEEKNDFFEHLLPPEEPILPEPETVKATLPERPPAVPVEKNWLLVPSVGTAVFVVLTAWLSVPEKNEKF